MANDETPTPPHSDVLLAISAQLAVLTDKVEQIQKDLNLLTGRADDPHAPDHATKPHQPPTPVQSRPTPSQSRPTPAQSRPTPSQSPPPPSKSPLRHEPKPTGTARAKRPHVFVQPFAGDRSKFSAFTQQLRLFNDVYEDLSDSLRIDHVGTFLRGEAMAWFHDLSLSTQQWGGSYHAFQEALEERFTDHYRYQEALITYETNSIPWSGDLSAHYDRHVHLRRKIGHENEDAAILRFYQHLPQSLKNALPMGYIGYPTLSAFYTALQRIDALSPTPLLPTRTDRGGRNQGISSRAVSYD